MFEHCMYFNTAALTRRLESEWTLAFKPFDLAPPQAFMLRAVLLNPGVTITKLANDLSISKPTATRALDGLTLKGFITRESISQDARHTAIYPTQAAKDIEAQLNAASAATTQKIKSMIGSNRFEDFVKEARSIHSSIK